MRGRGAWGGWVSGGVGAGQRGGVGAQRAAEGQLTGTGLVGLQVGLDQVCQSLERTDGIAFDYVVRLGAEPLHGPHLNDQTRDNSSVPVG
ncbi:hypothetical protein EYF80_010813 [Liparis tanakae]|uniref:Uncharacterized protein n=1 Tax=Liparis tanakae TaxID=230148 RepID=A0A4Z2IM95_9TELE|nr:hypothetical protein EYF80_010813 [Liparis tanakae]